MGFSAALISAVHFRVRNFLPVYTVASQTLFNAALTYGRGTPRGGNWQVGFNINNLLDRDPPTMLVSLCTPNPNPTALSQSLAEVCGAWSRLRMRTQF